MSNNNVVNVSSKTGRCPAADPVVTKLFQVYKDLLNHDGFGQMRVEMKILKRGQKEVIIHCGKQYRFVVDFPES